MVLDVIIGAPWELLCNLGPFVAVDLMRLEHRLLLLLRPRVLVDLWVEVVVPAELIKGYRSLHCLPVRVSMPYFDTIF